MEELRRKLAAAEATIGNLTKEIEEMETVYFYPIWGFTKITLSGF